MMPQAQRMPSGGSPRPSSVLYNQPSLNGSGSVLARDGSYRLRSESSRSSILGMPRRSNSRGASNAMQAGVPTREESHGDRSYRQSQQMPPGNRPAPPRRGSRGMGGGHTSGSIPTTASVPGSPYGIEGGPLSSSEEWKERGAAVEVRQELDADGKPVERLWKKGVKDFNFGRTLGEGSYSTVLAATDRQTLIEYAIKVLDKRHIIKEKKVKYVNIEKDTLNRLTEHPGVVRLYFTFQDERSLYFVLDLASGGELLGVLKRMTTFDEECTRFYGAQILDTIDYMHAKGVIHRDLKPENVLLDDHMHVKITDFGTAKILNIPRRQPGGNDGTSGTAAGNPMDGSEESRANSFVGTAEYVSPELLNQKNACKASDLWAFGCIIYQLLAGRPPFKAANEFQTFQKILNLEYEFPAGFPEVAKDLVDRLLVLDPARRLNIEHIKNHEFFDGIVWGRGLWKQKAPRLKSYVPPPTEPIKLNGSAASNGNGNSFPQNITPAHSTKAVHIASGNASNGISRPAPRVITELPPPSQLDIEWSPVLTRNNERILKLGNLVVLSAPAAHSPNSKSGTNGDNDAPKKFSRFFGSSTTKKRQRLVMVTSSARIIMAAAGGEEKKTKTEIPLLSAGCSWRSMLDPKGLTVWRVDTRDKYFTFEDPKSSTNDATTTAASTQEWLDTIERAKEIAVSQSVTNSYCSEDAFKDLPSSASTLGGDTALHLDNGPGRHTLQKSQRDSDVESTKGRKRFSKRQSKSGLTAVF
ncbi:MAG: pkb-activating kinase-like protein [Pleopsidium flavum]|nr:MAG: pkb-activating kinase-like protein [Pleopsidium flavum]